MFMLDLYRSREYARKKCDYYKKMRQREMRKLSDLRAQYNRSVENPSREELVLKILESEFELNLYLSEFYFNDLENVLENKQINPY